MQLLLHVLLKAATSALYLSPFPLKVPRVTSRATYDLPVAIRLPAFGSDLEMRLLSRPSRPRLLETVRDRNPTGAGEHDLRSIRRISCLNVRQRIVLAVNRAGYEPYKPR